MKRSGLKVMMKLIVLVKPLTCMMLLAIFMGVLGHLSASLITILAGYAVLDVLGVDGVLTMNVVFISIVIFAVLCHVYLNICYISKYAILYLVMLSTLLSIFCDFALCLPYRVQVLTLVY